MKQGVTITGHNTTGPLLCVAHDELRCMCVVLHTTTTMTVTSLAPYIV